MLWLLRSEWIPVHQQLPAEIVEKVDIIAETNTIRTAPATGEVGHLNAIPLKHHTLSSMAFEEVNTIPLRNNDTDAAAAQEMGPTKNVNEIWRLHKLQFLRN